MSAVSWTDPARRAHFEGWLAALEPRFGLEAASLAPASADASFRRYLRIGSGQGPLIIMDAPPSHEDVRPFMDIAARIEQAGLLGPRVLAADVQQGFLLLTDLGSGLYLQALQAADAAEADALMRGAVEALLHWQLRVDPQGLPPYDEALLRRELDLFVQWCVATEHAVDWTPEQAEVWSRMSGLLIRSALAQPTVAVHRDWMPRNLMRCPGGPGILDFQDAVRGPITYDLASLLRDAFISWDEERELDWAVRYWQQARRAGLPVAEDFGEFWRSVEWMGLQRHLKVLGIFCRLKHRDHKPHYAQDLPRFFAYATKVALRYRELSPLLGLIEPLSGFSTAEGFTLR